MLALLPLGTVARWAMLAYVASVFGAALLFQRDLAAWNVAYLMRVASALLSIFTLATILLSYVGWRWFWWLIPALTKFYPDLNGTWDAEIRWKRDGESGTVKATAFIKQNLFRLSIEVEAPDSDSRTLSAMPKKDVESGRAALHYHYLVTPHASQGRAAMSYNGAAILTLVGDSVDKLSGNYWTSHQSVGRISLIRRGSS